MALPIIQTATYKLTIPSTGQNVEYRPYLVKEEKSLIVAMESKDNNTMIHTLKNVVKACLFDKVTPDKLTMFDLEYIFVKLRAASAGEVSNIQVECRSETCTNMIPVAIDLSELELSGDVLDEKERTFMLTDDVGVTMKYPTVQDVLQSDSKTGGTDYDATIDMIVLSIESIFDKDNVYAAADETHQDLVNFIDGLSQIQLSKITGFFESAPALRKDIELSCNICLQTHSVKLEGMQSFF
jgi:hypothetical protein